MNQTKYNSLAHNIMNFSIYFSQKVVNCYIQAQKYFSPTKYLFVNNILDNIIIGRYLRLFIFTIPVFPNRFLFALHTDTYFINQTNELKLYTDIYYILIILPVL